MLRREFLRKMGLGATILAVPGPLGFVSAPFTENEEREIASLSFPLLKDVRLSESPFKTAMDKTGDYLLELEADRLLACFYLSENLTPKAPRYGGWESEDLQGHTLGHYLTACSLMYAASSNSKYKDRVDYIVSELQRLQSKAGDGYIAGIPDGRKLWKEVASGKIETENFSLNGIWSPWYNLHKTYAGLRDAYWFTGNEKSRQVLIDFSDWAVQFSDNLTDQEFQKMLECEYGGMNEVMADVYGITGDEKYMKLAERFNHEAVFEPLANGRDELKGLHANTQIPKIIGAAREHEFNENARLKKIAQFFWDQVTEKRSYIWGGNSFDEYFGELGKLHERVGKATSETCNTYNMLKLTEYFMRWEPNARYADYYERALYNHILASIDSKTAQVAYFLSSESGFFKTFSSPFHSFWCCRGTGMENHAKYGSTIYMHDDNNLYVNLFIPSELNWREKGVQLIQETSFPEKEVSSLKVTAEEPKEFILNIRRPYWVNSDFEVKVNGKEASSDSTPSGYVAIERKWQNGDRIDIRLPMQLHVEHMPNNTTKAAIMYGPLVLVGEFGTKWMHYPMPYATDDTEYFDAAAVEVPSVKVPGSSKITEFIQAVDGDALRFVLDSPDMSQTIKLRPFYNVNEQRYTVYWDLG